jgi:soluble lytic murein transglycosylase-like protein
MRKPERSGGKISGVPGILLLCLLFAFGPSELTASSISLRSWDEKKASSIAARSWSRETTDAVVRNSISRKPKGLGRKKWISMERVERFSQPIRYYSSLHGIDANLTRAIIWVESRGNPRSISPVGARGLMQLMPRTAREMGVTDSFDADQNIRGGLRFFKSQLDRFGKLEEALWAYNAGPGAVRERRLPAETMAYIKQVLSVRSYLNNEGKTKNDGKR